MESSPAHARSEDRPEGARQGDSPGLASTDLLARYCGPAELYAVVARRVRERGFLLEIDHVWRAALARLSSALDSPLARQRLAGLSSRDETSSWVRGQVDEAIDVSIRALERAQWDAGSSQSEERESLAGWLADNLGMEWNQARAAMSAFNRLPDDVRRTFVDLLSSGEPPTRKGRLLTSEQSRHVRQALATLMRAATPFDAALADIADADDSSEGPDAHKAPLEPRGDPQ